MSEQVPGEGNVHPSGEITRLLQELRRGNRQAESELIPHIYPELRRLAARYMRGEDPGHTLQPTALVHEAYLRLAGQQNIDWQNRSHFFAVAAQIMRHVLVDHARKQRAAKRPDAHFRVDLDDVLLVSAGASDLVLQIDEALDSLEKLDARQCRIVEMRFFGGLTEEEIGEVLGIAPRTVKREWSMAKAWLRGRLSRRQPRDDA